LVEEIKKMILVLGAKGMLGQELTKIFGKQAIGWDRGDCDVTDVDNLKLKIFELKPSAIINCVAYNDVDGAEENKQLAFKLNAEVVGNLASIAKELGIPLVHFSSNYVFDGEKGEYKEQDVPNPISVYGKSKYEGEQQLIANTDKYFLVRTSVLFGLKGQSGQSKKSFVELMLDLASKGSGVKAVDEEINSLTYVVDLASQIKLLLSQDHPFGIYHITNSGQGSWYKFAKEIFDTKGIKVSLKPVTRAEFPRKALTPKKADLINTKLPPLRPWQDALKEYLETYVL